MRPGRRLRALWKRLVREDAGTTLTELLVGMLVMGIFMTIFTGAVVSMAKTVVRVDAVTSSAAQVDSAFLALDKLVRYADAITTIGTGPSGSWYVELDTVTPTDKCTQLQVDFAAKKLQVRTWPAKNPPATPPSWTTLASDLQTKDPTGATYQPFTVAPAGSSAPASTRFQQLTITLTAGTSKEAQASTTRASVTFTALNSSAAAPVSATLCRPSGAYRP